MDSRLAQFSTDNEKLTKTVEGKLSEIRTDNEKRLEQMRQTVEEKLQSTLENRLSKSFSQVGEQLENVYKQLGEMQTLAQGVGNLEKVLTNVMTFVRTMLPVGALGLAAVMVLTRLLPCDRCEAPGRVEHRIPVIKAAVYSAVFLLCIAAVFRIVPDWVCLAAAVAAAVVCDIKLLMKVDYCLLATFVCFFVFVGNIARIDAVSGFFSGILSGRELIVAALLSQFISNVPAAVMLAEFTGKGTELLLGVDIGGFGTIIASMASLIAFQIYRGAERAKSGKYMAVFTAVNFGMLLFLLAVRFIVSAVTK